MAKTSPHPAIALGNGGLIAYGALGLPLAFAALPVYVHTPRLYAEGLGLSLALVGAVLLASRIVDAITDPLIGWASDRIARRRLLVGAGLPLLMAGMIALLAPPDGAGATWLAVSVIVATLGYSLATINYHAWGAELGRSPQQRTTIVAFREGFGIVGVVLAASLPTMLAGDDRSALAALAWIFVPLLTVAALITLGFAPRGPSLRRQDGSIFSSITEALHEPRLIRLLAVFAANGIAAAVPSATVLFFVSDVLGAGQFAGLFLAVYFLAAAAGLPLWAALAARLGKLRSWAASMVLAMLVFVWAATLGEGALVAFGVICVISGVALGADLTLPPAMLADALARAGGAARGGAWFGLWNFVNKTNLALAAGLALPLLAWLGYQPGVSTGDGVRALALTYGALPVALKLLALALLWHWRRHFTEE